jgi:hypothetical protein
MGALNGAIRANHVSNGHSAHNSGDFYLVRTSNANWYSPHHRRVAMPTVTGREA